MFHVFSYKFVKMYKSNDKFNSKDSPLFQSTCQPTVHKNLWIPKIDNNMYVLNVSLDYGFHKMHKVQTKFM